MGLFRTSLLVVLSCAVMSVQAANWNKSKAKPIVSSINPVEIIDVASAPNTLCRPDGTKTKPYANYKYPQFNYEEFTTSREATTNKLAHSMHAVTVTLLNTDTRDVDGFQRWIKKFVAAIDDGYYSKVDTSKGKKTATSYGTPDPGYGAKVVLLASANLVSVVDSLGFWRGDQREKVIEWGNRLYSLSKIDRSGRSLSRQGADNVAFRASTYISWGLVAGVPEAVSYGKQAFNVAMNYVDDDGSLLFWSLKSDRASNPREAFREDDKTIGLLVLAAHVAKKAGDDLYSSENRKGKTLHDAVAWTIKANISPQKTEQADFLATQQLISTGMRYWHWSWTPIYATDFPDTKLGSRVGELSDKYRTDVSGYYHFESMGPTSCVYDRR